MHQLLTFQQLMNFLLCIAFTFAQVYETRMHINNQVYEKEAPEPRLFFPRWVGWVGEGWGLEPSTWVVKQVGLEGRQVLKESMAYTYGQRYGGFFLDRCYLGGGNSNIFHLHPYLGKIPILTNMFQRGWNHQPVVFLEIWREHKNLKVDQGWYVWFLLFFVMSISSKNTPPARVMLSGRICQGRGQEL